MSALPAAEQRQERAKRQDRRRALAARATAGTGDITALSLARTGVNGGDGTLSDGMAPASAGMATAPSLRTTTPASGGVPLASGGSLPRQRGHDGTVGWNRFRIRLDDDPAVGGIASASEGVTPLSANLLLRQPGPRRRSRRPSWMGRTSDPHRRPCSRRYRNSRLGRNSVSGRQDGVSASYQ